MNITDIVGFFQVVVPYLEVIIVLVVAFFVISFDVTLRKTRLKTSDGTKLYYQKRKNRFFWMGVTQEKD